jgi:hypothetical protein
MGLLHVLDSVLQVTIAFICTTDVVVSGTLVACNTKRAIIRIFKCCALLVNSHQSAA